MKTKTLSLLVTVLLGCAALPINASLLDLFPEQLEDAEGNAVSREVLEGKIVGVYFSAEWCPPCRGFTPSLVEFRNANKEKFEVVFVSSDRNAEDQRKYMSGYQMAFPAVPHGSGKVAALREMFNVRGIPHLGILDSDGNILAQNGRMTVVNNPEGALEEWSGGAAAGAVVGGLLGAARGEGEDGEARSSSAPSSQLEIIAEFPGRLTPQSPRLEEGEYFQKHTFRAEPGTRLRVDLHSEDFDAYLVVVSPTGERWVNDDADWEGGTDSRVEFTVEGEGGEYVIYATTFGEGELGEYRVVLSRPGDIDVEGIEFAGTLDETAEVRVKSGSYMQSHTFQGEQGRQVVIDMLSSDFDTYLIVVSPEGQRWANDDFQMDATRSRVEIELPETGQYTILATSFSPGETGAYRVIVSGLGEQ